MMTDNEVMAELKSDSKINRARREFSSACGWIQQAGQQQVPLSPIHIRRMEFEAVMRIVAILTEQAYPMTMQEKIEQPIILEAPIMSEAMVKHGLHPLECPAGDDHHTDLPFTEADHELAELAFWLGGLFIDKEKDTDPETPLKDTYWYCEMSSLDVWRRVARALRIHGLKIVDA